MPGGTRGKPRGIGERLVERLAVLEQRAEPLAQSCWRASALALKLIGEAVEPSRELQRDRRRERGSRCTRASASTLSSRSGGRPPVPVCASVRSSSRSKSCAGAGTLGIRGMLSFEPVEALGASKRVERLHRADFRRLERVEDRSAGRRDDLDFRLAVVVAAEARSTAAVEAARGPSARPECSVSSNA